MGKIEGNHAATRYAEVQTEYRRYRQDQQRNTAQDRSGYSAWQPEYQNDVPGRHYEIAEWLREMGTLGQTSTAEDAGVPKEGQMTGGVTEPGQPTVPGDPNAVVVQEEAEKEKKAEEEKAKMPWESDEAMSQEETELERLQKLLEKYKERAEEEKESARKPLRYKYQRVSSSIRSAKTVMQASNALVKANSSLSQLRRQAASGQYSENEIAMAQTHARKMVRTARTKLRNIKSELNQKNNNTLAKNHASEKMGTVVKAVRAEQKLDAIQQKDREMLKLEKLIQRKEAMYKNRHRRKENWDLMEADMEYLRRRVEYLKNHEEEPSATNQAMGIDETNVFTSGDQSVILEGVAAADAIDPAAAVEMAVEAAVEGDIP